MLQRAVREVLADIARAERKRRGTALSAEGTAASA